MARRLLLILLVLMSGCASLEQQCGMKPVSQTATVPYSGSVRVQWIYGQDVGPERYGVALPFDGFVIIRMKGEPPRFDDVCAMAKIGHEVVHGMGGKHE